MVAGLPWGAKLFLAALFSIWLQTAWGKSKKGKITFDYGKRVLQFDNKIGKSGSFKESKVRSISQCAGVCQRDDSCASFFYNKETKECQGQETILQDHTQLDNSPGSKYYKIHQQKPVKIRTTPKLMKIFKNRNFFDEVAKFDITGSPDDCEKACEEKYPKCLASNYVPRPKSHCKIFENVHINKRNSKTTFGSFYQRAARSFCSDDENYIFISKLKLCFKYHQQEVSWNEAELACKAEEAHLINVETREVKRMIERLMDVSSDYDESTHIGIDDKKKEGRYVDWQNKPINKTLWDGNFIGKTSHHCVNLNRQIKKSFYNLIDCDNFKSNFICSKNHLFNFKH